MRILEVKNWKKVAPRQRRMGKAPEEGQPWAVEPTMIMIIVFVVTLITAHKLLTILTSLVQL